MVKCATRVCIQLKDLIKECNDNDYSDEKKKYLNEQGNNDYN